MPRKVFNIRLFSFHYYNINSFLPTFIIYCYYFVKIIIIVLYYGIYIIFMNNYYNVSYFFPPKINEKA